MSTDKTSQASKTRFSGVFRSVRESPHFSTRNLVVVMVSFALIGSILLFSSHAATPTANIEPEAKTVTSPATVGSDATASGGQYVQFKAAASGGGGCPAYPAFPDASCTGVPSGYPTTTVSSLASTANGQTIDGKFITGDLTINHSNVTVTNTRVTGHVYANANGLTLQNVDIGPDTCPASGSYEFSINGDGWTAIRTHIHNNVTDPIRVGGGLPILIQDSVIDRTCFYPGDHLDAIQFYDPGGVGTLTVVHSYIDARASNNSDFGNSAFFYADGPGSGTRLYISYSRLAGGGYTTSLYDAHAGSGVIYDVHDNVYIKNSYQYAPCASSNSIPFDGTSGVKFTNNKQDDGTAVSC